MAVAQVCPDILLAAQLMSSVPLFPLNATELSDPPHQGNISAIQFSQKNKRVLPVFTWAPAVLSWTNIRSNKSRQPGPCTVYAHEALSYFSVSDSDEETKHTR